MNKMDCIILLGDIMVMLDTQRGSLSPDTSGRKELDDICGLLREKQSVLAQLMFDEGTAPCKAATAQLTAITQSIKESIADVGHTSGSFALLDGFVTAVDDLISAARGVV